MFMGKIITGTIDWINGHGGILLIFALYILFWAICAYNGIFFGSVYDGI